jgi:hypothetical protein
MKRTLKTCLLAGASAAALGLMVSGPAKAFDQVDWDWTATIDETIIKNVTITIDLAPVGLGMVEDLQVLIGDVTAVALVDGINNNRPAGEGGTGVFEGQFHYGLGGRAIDDGFNTPGIVILPPNGCAGPADATCVDETDGAAGTGINGTVYVKINLDELVGETLDAVTQLPQVVNAATAVGNNVNITADVALQLHEGQFVVGGPCGECDPAAENTVFHDTALIALIAAVNDVNTNLILAGMLGYEALNGNISPSKITAVATVTNILNATVDNAATAVANNKTVDLTYLPDNGLLIGDMTQFAYADVAATAVVANVDINNYANLGGTFRPIVNNVATAVGNNLNINVTAAP